MTLIADGVKHSPYIHVLHDRNYIWADGTLGPSASALRLPLEEIIERAPIIFYADDLRIVIEGQDGVFQGYSLQVLEQDETELMFTGGLIQKTDGSFYLMLPETPGEYLLSLSVRWSNGASNSNREAFRIDDYFFRVLR